MAVLSRNNLVHAQRVDVNDLRSIDSYVASDLRAIIKFICGDRPYIVDGCKVSRVISNKIYVQVNNMFLFLPDNDAGSFYRDSNNREDIEISIPTNGRTFLELKLIRKTGSPVVKGLWDSLAVTPTSPHGTEYQAQIDSENYLDIELVVNSSGFGNGIPIATIDMQAGELFNIQDNRNMFFKTEVGGQYPETEYKKPFSPLREPQLLNGTNVGDEIDSPFRDKDNFGALNPSGFKSLKDYIDGIAMVLAEIQGTSLWYTTAGASQIVDDLSIKTIFQYSEQGYSCEGQKDVAIVWNRDEFGNRDFKIRSEGDGLLKFSSNYSRLYWVIGGTYSHDRVYDNNNFSSNQLDDNSSVFVNLMHDIMITDSYFEWRPTEHSNTISSQKLVKAQEGAFSLMAIGDFIRKKSDAKTIYQITGFVQDGIFHEPVHGTMIPLNVDEIGVDIDIQSSSTEQSHYYRTHYSNEDIFSENEGLIEQSTHIYTSSQFFWLGRRRDDNFILRNHAVLFSGNSVYTLNNYSANAQRDQSLEINILAGTRFQVLEGNPQIRFFDGVTYLNNHVAIKITKQLKENWNNTTSSNNLALSHYELKIPAVNDLIFNNNGDQLWLELIEESGTHSLTGKYTITPSNQSFVANSVNRNIHFLARRQDINGTPYLVFTDGQMLSINGIHEIAQKNFDSKVIHRHGRAVNIREVNISSQVYLSDELIMVDKTNNDNLNITLPDTNNPELIKGTLYEIKDSSMMCNVDSFITIKGFNVDDSIDGEEDYIIQSEGEAIKICYLGNKRWRII